MARNPEKSDPEIEITVEELDTSMPDISGMRMVGSFFDQPSSRFTDPPPSSPDAQNFSLFSCDSALVDDDIAFPCEGIIDGEDPTMPTLPPSDEYMKLIESETRFRVLEAVSTPPVEMPLEHTVIDEFPADAWERACDNSVRLFRQMNIDLQPLIEHFQQCIGDSKELDYRHELVLTMIALRDVTNMMQAYLVDGIRPDIGSALGEFIREELKNAGLRDSIYPDEESFDAFIQDHQYDTFQQIRTIMKSRLEELDTLLQKNDALTVMYNVLVFGWQPE